MKNELILSLETATRGGSLALSRGDSILASSTGIAEESHSTTLLSQIESLLTARAVSLRDVDVFAVASGPGSFTGLRIGLATMKAFASTLDRPCVGVPTLEVVALGGGVSEHTYAMLPAGRGEVFSQSFKVSDAAPFVTPLSEPEHLPPKVLLDRLSGQGTLHWAGPGSHLYVDLISARADALGYDFVNDATDKPRGSEYANDGRWTLAPFVEQLAQYVAILAFARLDERGNSAEDLRAIYVRPSDAELNK
jgi:tRNA threonylcarbamoyladenosine biosynthesis protein TsaB